MHIHCPVKVKIKVNQSDCIAPCMVQTTLKRSGFDHTAFNLQRTPCLPLPRKRSLDGSSTECGGEHLIAAHYSFIVPERMKGELSILFKYLIFIIASFQSAVTFKIVKNSC